MKKGILLDENGDLKINVVRDKAGKIISGLCIGEIDYPISAEFGNIEELSKSISPDLPFFEELKQETIKYRNEFTQSACEHNFKIAQQNREKAKLLEIQNNDLQTENKDLTTTLKTNFKHLHQIKTPQKPANSLKPNITDSQIIKLCEALKGIFEATLEQWQALFSENEIKLLEPIRANAITDIVVLFYHLKEREFIETSKYPSILERAKAFSINDKIVTAKQINKPKAENYNFPLIGKNYENINKAVANL